MKLENKKQRVSPVKGLLEDLVDRGLNRQRRYLVVVDGSKALHAGVERVSGEQVVPIAVLLSKEPDKL